MQTNDACFDKAKVLFEGEKHVDSSRCSVYWCTEDMFLL